MIFSRACEYAIRAVVFLAGRDSVEPIQVRDVAKALQIPQPFLAKVVQILSRQGLLNTTKGPGGGIALARPPGETALLQVVDAVDGLSVTRNCVLGFPECSDEMPCPMHKDWARIRRDLVQMLENQSIEMAAAAMPRKF